MTEEKWFETDLFSKLLHLEKTGWGSDRKLRLFACVCCRRIWDLLEHVCHVAIERSEQFVEGSATLLELKRAADKAARYLEQRFQHLGLIPTHHGVRDLEMFLF